MPSFDIVSKIDKHELSNSINQTEKVLQTRFDFKGVDASVEQKDTTIRIESESEMQVGQIYDVLTTSLVKRGIDLKTLDQGEIQHSGKKYSQSISLREGIDKVSAKKITKLIKESKLKVQSSIQGDVVRVTGKQRNDLQSVMAFLKDSDIDLPLQYINMRD